MDMNDLPEEWTKRDRAIWDLYEQGFSIREIGTTLGLSESVVKNTIWIRKMASLSVKREGARQARKLAGKELGEALTKTQWSEAFRLFVLEWDFERIAECLGVSVHVVESTAKGERWSEYVDRRRTKDRMSSIFESAEQQVQARVDYESMLEGGTAKMLLNGDIAVATLVRCHPDMESAFRMFAKKGDPEVLTDWGCLGLPDEDGHVRVQLWSRVPRVKH